MTYTFKGVFLQELNIKHMDKVTQIMERWNALQPLSERDRELLSLRFTIDFNYNSNHIEGNTLTYGQTEILLLFVDLAIEDI